MEYEKQLYGNFGNGYMKNNSGGLVKPQVTGIRKTPEKKFRAGSIGISIWHNVGKNNKGEERVYRTVSLERSYVNKAGVWHYTNSLRINDLPKAVLLLNKAYEYLVLKQNLYEPQSISGVVKDETTEEIVM